MAARGTIANAERNRPYITQIGVSRATNSPKLFYIFVCFRGVLTRNIESSPRKGTGEGTHRISTHVGKSVGISVNPRREQSTKEPRHEHRDGQRTLCPSTGDKSVRKSTNCVQTTTQTQWEKVAMLAATEKLGRAPPPSPALAGRAVTDRRASSSTSRHGRRSRLTPLIAAQFSAASFPSPATTFLERLPNTHTTEARRPFTNRTRPSLCCSRPPPYGLLRAKHFLSNVYFLSPRRQPILVVPLRALIRSLLPRDIRTPPLARMHHVTFPSCSQGRWEAQPDGALSFGAARRSLAFLFLFLFFLCWKLWKRRPRPARLGSACFGRVGGFWEWFFLGFREEYKERGMPEQQGQSR